MDHVRYLRLTASLKDYRGKTARAEAVAAAVHTPFNLHLHLATSTHFPRVSRKGGFQWSCDVGEFGHGITHWRGLLRVSLSVATAKSITCLLALSGHGTVH